MSQRYADEASSQDSPLRQIREGRRAPARYLAQRGLPRPRIPWDRLHAFADRARAGSK